LTVKEMWSEDEIRSARYGCCVKTGRVFEQNAPKMGSCDKRLLDLGTKRRRRDAGAESKSRERRAVLRGLNVVGVGMSNEDNTMQP
jgi:hypothetical protein